MELKRTTLFLIGDLTKLTVPALEIEFDKYGRHRRTLHALTGAKLYEFVYDSKGRLVEIEDGDGNRTTVERETDGEPVVVITRMASAPSLHWTAVVILKAFPILPVRLCSSPIQKTG